MLYHWMGVRALVAVIYSEFTSILELPWTSGDPNFDRKSAQKKAKIGSPVYFFIFFLTLYFFSDAVFFSRAFKKSIQ